MHSTSYIMFPSPCPSPCELSPAVLGSWDGPFPSLGSAVNSVGCIFSLSCHLLSLPGGWFPLSERMTGIRDGMQKI